MKLIQPWTRFADTYFFVFGCSPKISARRPCKSNFVAIRWLRHRSPSLPSGVVRVLRFAQKKTRSSKESQTHTLLQAHCSLCPLHSKKAHTNGIHIHSEETAHLQNHSSEQSNPSVSSSPLTATCGRPVQHSIYRYPGALQAILYHHTHLLRQCRYASTDNIGSPLNIKLQHILPDGLTPMDV